MLRESDLIRAILLAVEADDRCEVLRLPKIEGYSGQAIHFHTRLLIEKGFLRTLLPDHFRRRDWLCLSLTWEGYELLDTIRDPAVWRSVKRAASKVGSWSIETLAAIAKAVILSQIEAATLNA